MVCKLKESFDYKKYLRLGSIIVAVVSTLFELLSLVLNLIVLVVTPWLVVTDDEMIGPVLIGRFLLFLFTVIAFIKLSVSCGLVVGLRMRLPDHLEVWYKVYSVMECLCVGLVAIIAVYLRKTYSDSFWIIIVTKLVTSGITFFFILIIRSYHHQMKREPNYYQDLSCKTQPTSTYYEKPKEISKGEVLVYSADTKRKPSCTSEEEKRNENFPITNKNDENV